MKSKERGFDQIFVRDENKYWKWGISELVGTTNFFFTNAQGEWWCTDNHDGTVTVKWKYTWFSRNIFTQPFSWLFVKLFWKMVMKNGMKNIKHMAEMETPYIYKK